jgi:transcriptional regulator with XRE-family HTH domain
MMTTSQMKAARALLDWTQNDLARAAGLHLNVINNIERGTSNPRRGTIEKLQETLEHEGIAFLNATGVELKREAVGVIRLQGENFLRDLTAGIIAALPVGGEVLSLLSDIRNFSGHDPAAGKTYQAEKEAKNLKERLITRDMPGFYPRHSQTYRVVAPDLLGPVDTVIYADCTAHIFWNQNEALILKNADLAATKRRLFERLWHDGHEPVRRLRAAND